MIMETCEEGCKGSKGCRDCEYEEPDIVRVQKVVLSKEWMDECSSEEWTGKFTSSKWRDVQP